MTAERGELWQILRTLVEEATCADWSGEDDQSVRAAALTWCGKYHAQKAERDQLRAETEALRVALLGIASANPAERGIEWAKAYASDGLSGTGSELYIRWLETFKEAEALRVDVAIWKAQEAAS
ncbi:hypothetical protein SSTU70S_04942 [Stutzerimonas stutzeri]